MVSAKKITVATMAMLFAFGCEKNGGENTADSKYLGKEECVPASKDDGTMATLAKIASATVSLTNCLYREPGKAKAPYRQISAEIGTLPPDVAGQCAKNTIKSILAVPYERLEVSERLRAVDVMCDVIWRIQRLGLGEVDLWECHVLLLARARDVMQYTQSREGSQAGSFFMYVSRRLKNVTESLEGNLAYWSSLPSPSAVRIRRNKIVTEEEYAIVKGNFERFLGRPIRRREEIRPAKVEKVSSLPPEDAQREAERRKLAAMIEEDRRTGRKDAWYVGRTTNLQGSTTNAPMVR